MKTRLRKEAAGRRGEISVNDVSNLSEKVIANLRMTGEYRSAGMVFCYVSVGSEVDTRPLIRQLLDQEGKRVAVPWCNPATGTMSAVEISGLEELKPGVFGIPEPDSTVQAPLDPSGLDLIVVPGIAFDGRGYRIGYGGGYYDRFLSEHGKGKHTLGLAFEAQLIDAVPVEEHDVPVDGIATESRIIICREINEKTGNG